MVDLPSVASEQVINIPVEWLPQYNRMTEHTAHGDVPFFSLYFALLKGSLSVKSIYNFKRIYIYHIDPFCSCSFFSLYKIFRKIIKKNIDDKKKKE